MSDRLPLPWGRLLDRDRPLTFTFEGARVAAFEGDTVSSALLGQGTWLQGRSLKYHRPRGPFTLNGDDANTLVQLPDEPDQALQVLRGDPVMEKLVGLESDLNAARPELSVVMPAYNAATTLERTYREVPLDVVDDLDVV